MGAAHRITGCLVAELSLDRFFGAVFLHTSKISPQSIWGNSALPTLEFENLPGGNVEEVLSL
jgi:hypothetical protein